MQKSPPRYVPTLTQVVTDTLVSRENVHSLAPAASLPTLSGQLQTHELAQQLRQQLLTRTRQYLDIELQRRIREAVSQLALEHAHKLIEALKPQLEATISQVVEEAVQQAVAHASTHAP